MSDKTWYPGWATGRLLSPREVPYLASGSVVYSYRLGIMMDNDGSVTSWLAVYRKSINRNVFQPFLFFCEYVTWANGSICPFLVVHVCDDDGHMYLIQGTNRILNIVNAAHMYPNRRIWICKAHPARTCIWKLNIFNMLRVHILHVLKTNAVMTDQKTYIVVVKFQHLVPIPMIRRSSWRTSWCWPINEDDRTNKVWSDRSWKWQN